MSNHLSKKVDFGRPFDKQKACSVLRSLCDAVATVDPTDVEVSRRCALAFRYIDKPCLSLLKEVTAAPVATGYLSYYLQAQLAAFFKKSVQFDLGIDTREAALALFHKSEELCSQTNESLRSPTDPNYGARATLIFKMSRKISKILGDAPSLDMIPFGFGPGANVGCNKSTNVRSKLSADLTTTVDCMRTYGQLHANPHTWPGHARSASLVRGSKFTTVPKTTLVDRGINLEPILNAYIQKGFGSLIRARLLAVGIDLTDQTRNQRMARYGSLHGDICTIDLSMASDLIAYNLVMDLLPIEWFTLLDACRSPECELPNGSWHQLEKFSSMGNGATFELESLIFYALLLVVADDFGFSASSLSVYGDDLICPSIMFDSVCSALSLLGFIPNKEKSFGTGPFRESCGKDYFDGIEVRPVFLKEKLSIKELYRLHNFFYRQGYISSIPNICLSFLRKHEQTFGPDGTGDGHLITSHLKARCDKRGWEPFYLYHSYISSVRRRMVSCDADEGAFIYLSRNGVPDSTSLPSDTLYQERSTSPKFVRKTLRTPVA